MLEALFLLLVLAADVGILYLALRPGRVVRVDFQAPDYVVSEEGESALVASRRVLKTRCLPFGIDVVRHTWFTAEGRRIWDLWVLHKLNQAHRKQAKTEKARIEDEQHQ